MNMRIEFGKDFIKTFIG